jgi:hypothetical protein
LHASGEAGIFLHSNISSRGTKAFRDAPAKEPVDRVSSVRGLFFAVEQVNEAVRAQQSEVRAAPSNTS